MKRIIVISAIIILAIALAGCGVVKEENTGVTEPVSAYSPAEQEMIDFAVNHIDQMEALVNDTLDVFDDGQGMAEVADRMTPIADSYAQLCDEYNATNGGDLAGGKVTTLEALWEECGADIRYADTAILDCYLDPDNVDVDKATERLAEAKIDLGLIRDELAKLTDESY